MAPDRHSRESTIVDFSDEVGAAGRAQWSARGQNFRLDWHRAGDAAMEVPLESEDELLVMLTHEGGAQVSPADGGDATDVGGRSAAILPAGAWRLRLSPDASAAVFTSLREHEDAPEAVNAAAYATRDERLVPVGASYVARVEGVRVHPFESIVPPEASPRLRILQTSTLSVTIVEYDGPRDPKKLSPHWHEDFEQGAACFDGGFVHHLRSPWLADSDEWRPDVHDAVGAPSVAIIPAFVTHTTQGVGPGRHLHVDFFSPPRSDYIAKGWVFNSADYEPVDDERLARIDPETSSFDITYAVATGPSR